MTLKSQKFPKPDRVFVLGSSLTFLFGMIGCDDGSSAPTNARVYEVRGKVLLPSGKPLNGGHIYFVSKDGPLSPEATIAPDGSFSLISGPSGEGAPPGNYKVRVEPADPSQITTRLPTSRRKALPFPSKYLDEDSSGLNVAIKAQPNHLEPFLLK